MALGICDRDGLQCDGASAGGYCTCRHYPNGKYTEACPKYAPKGEQQ